MPLELSPLVVRRVLFEIRALDPDAADDVQAALEYLADPEDESEQVVISRYDLQMFLWYQFPRKWLASLKEKEALTAALGDFFERFGDLGMTYASICRSPETRELLRACEEEDSGVRKLFRRMFAESGIEPPDTLLVKWGSVMGLEEALVHHAVAIELERAFENGRLVQTQSGFKRRRAELVVGFLGERPEDLDGKSRVQAIEDERLESWARGRPERRSIIEPVVPLLRSAPDDPLSDAGLAPLQWLLDRAVDGLSLTQTGALSQALVREAAERFPNWWKGAALFGPPHREDEVTLLWELHDLARRTRLLRLSERKLVLTARGKALRSAPKQQLEAVAPHLIEGSPFYATVRELLAAVLLAESEVPFELDDVYPRVHRAIVAEGWRAKGESELPNQYEVAGAGSSLIWVMESLDLVQFEEMRNARRLRVSEAGRRALVLALRARAVAPRTSI